MPTSPRPPSAASATPAAPAAPGGSTEPAAPATPAATAAEVAAAAEHLRRGGLVAFPTETVYGLGADASDPEAVARIFAAKGRPADHPLIVHLAAADQLDRWATDVPDAARRLAARFWPGPLTLILRKRPEVPDAVTGGQPTVGLRVPGHPVAHALLRAFGGGVAAPSANRFGRVSPTTRAHVLAELGDRVDVVLEGGPSAVGLESTIVDLSGDRPRLLRPGGIAAAELADVLGVEPTREGTGAPRTPGRLPSHYAPRTPVVVVEREALPQAVRDQVASGRAVAVLTPSPDDVPDRPGVTVVATATTPEAYARDLYAHLADVDRLAADVVLVERPPVDPGWEAVHDRLGRAEGVDPHTPRVLAVTSRDLPADDVAARVVPLVADLPGVVDLGTWCGPATGLAAGARLSGPGRDIHVTDVRTDGVVTVLVVEASDANRGIPAARHELVRALEATAARG